MVVVVVLAAVVLAAVGCWVAQQMYGLGITGMNNSNSWGLYIMAFMFFVGLSAGGLIVASSAHVFGIESFKRVSVPAVITSIVCICCAGAFVLIDLGGVARVWRMFVGLNFISPLAWDMIVITCYLVINVVGARRRAQGGSSLSCGASGCHPGAQRDGMDFRPADC